MSSSTDQRITGRHSNNKLADFKWFPIRSIPLIIGAIALLFYSYMIFHYLPTTQFVKYPKAAQLYLDGQLPKERLLDFSPLYFYLHLLIQKYAAAWISLIQWLQILLISLASVLLFKLLSAFYRTSIAAIGTIVFLLNNSIIVYTQALEPEAFVIFFLLAFVFFVMRPGNVNHVLAGLFFSLGVLTRPNFLPVFFLLPIHFLLQNKDRRRWLISTALFTTPLLVCLLALWIRNTKIVGSFSPVVMNPGTVIFEGNNPNSWGFSSTYPSLFHELVQHSNNQPDYQHQLYRIFARRITSKNLSVPEVNAYWTAKATNFLLDNPRHSVKLLSTKILHFFHEYEWHDLLNAYWNSRKLQTIWFLNVPFALISAMTLVGMLLQRSNWRKCLLFYGIFFCQFASMLITYISARQRVAIISIFVFFSCFTIRFMFENKKRLVKTALVLIPLSLLLHFQTDLMKEETYLWGNVQDSYNFLEDAYRKRNQNNLKEASTMSSLSLASAPWLIDTRRPANLSFQPGGFAKAALRFLRPKSFSGRFDYSMLCIEAGIDREAEKVLTELVEAGYQFKRESYSSSEPYFYLGRAAELAKDLSKAKVLFQEALKRSPGDPSVLAHLAALTGSGEYSKKLFRYSDDIDAQFFLGKAFLEIGKPSEAVRSFNYVVSKLPEYRRAKIYLAAALGEAGLHEKAASCYRQAIKMQQDPVILEQQIIFIFERLSQKNPQDPFALYSYGVVLRQFGHYAQAIQVQKTALQHKPDSTEIKTELTALEKAINRYK